VDLEEEGKNGGEPARPLEKLEMSAQTSSSSTLTSAWGAESEVPEITEDV